MVKFDGGDPIRFLVDSLKGGDVVPVEWEGFPAVIVHDPALISLILIQHQKKFVRSGGPPRLPRLLGNGLLRSQGETHLKQRRLTQQAFQPKQFPYYETKMEEVICLHLDRLEKKGKADLHPFLTELTLAIVGKTFFGMNWNAEVQSLGIKLNYLIEALAPHQNRLREKCRAFLFERVCRKVDGFLFGQIAEKKRLGAGSDLLSVLVLARDLEGDGRAMEQLALRDELMTLLIAGHETLTSVLSWAFYLLATDREVQRKIRRETDLSPSSVTAGVFSEAMRLYPPAWILFRKAKEAVSLPMLEISEGDHVIISPYALGRHPKWFADVTKFDPDRWRAPNLPPGLFIPFGLGNRRCIGEQFSWAEALRILKRFCERFEFGLASEGKIKELPRFTLRPSPGVPVELIKILP